jgi:hypothetical protein
VLERTADYHFEAWCPLGWINKSLGMQEKPVFAVFLGDIEQATLGVRIFFAVKERHGT